MPGLDPTSAAAHENVAQVFDDLANRSAAHAHYEQWVRLDPSPRAKKALALSYLWVGKLMEASSESAEAHSDHLQEGSALCNEAPKLIKAWQTSFQRYPIEAHDSSIMNHLHTHTHIHISYIQIHCIYVYT